MDLKNALGPNPIETIVQAISALATAAAAIFAALSARSAAYSAKEMERARELSNAPVITITPSHDDISHYMDISNGYDSTHPHKDHFYIENHGNGPALNLHVHYKMELNEPDIIEEVLVAERTGENPNKCFVSSSGVRWEGRHHGSDSTMMREGSQIIISLAKSEVENISIPDGIMRCWFIDAVSFNILSIRNRKHVAHLTISVVFDTVLRKAQQKVFHFRLISKEMPPLGFAKDGWGGNPTYVATIEPAGSH